MVLLLPFIVFFYHRVADNLWYVCYCFSMTFINAWKARFVSLPGLRKFSYHSKQRITLQAPLLVLHLSKSHTEAIMHVPQIVTYAVKEKGMEYKGEQRWALVEPWCKQWSCCGCQKGTSPDEATLNIEEINPVAIAIIELRLSERISKGVSQSVGIRLNTEFLKFHNNFLEWIKNDLKAFLSLAMPKLYCLDVTK